MKFINLHAASFLAFSAILLSACQPSSQTETGTPEKHTQNLEPAKPSGPPPGAAAMGPPTYQMRAQIPAGDRLSAGRDGKALFENLCGACHLEWGMGTNLLVRQVVAMDMTPDKAKLANREDLTADYVKTVVRNGKMAMPRLTKVDVTDAELDAIAKYLADEK